MPKRKPLRIAMVSALPERVPPRKYGGIERFVYTLTEELVKRGHKVSLFASGDSTTSAKLVSVVPRSLRESKLLDAFDEFTTLNIGTVYNQQSGFDVVHDNTGVLYALLPAQLSAVPTVVTLHGRITALNKRIYETFNKANYVGISKAQVANAPKVNVVKVIHHGYNFAKYPFSKKPDDYLLFVGRISREKGVHHAIAVAQALNMPLIIAAKLEKVDLRYFDDEVGHHLTDDIRWIGEVDDKERNKLMSKAKCMLMPVTWKEPFGLTMIEAMACGAPVVGFRRGSVPEIIAHGKSGYVVEDLEEMIEAVENIDQVDRKDVRAHALANFNAKRMVDEYEDLYYRLAEQAAKRKRV